MYKGNILHFAGPHAARFYRHLTKRACPVEHVRTGGAKLSVTLGCFQLCFEFDRGRSNRVLTCGFPYFVQALVCYLSARRTILWFIWRARHKGPKLCKTINSEPAQAALEGCQPSSFWANTVKVLAVIYSKYQRKQPQVPGFINTDTEGRGRSSAERAPCCSLH